MDEGDIEKAEKEKPEKPRQDCATTISEAPTKDAEDEVQEDNLENEDVHAYRTKNS